MIRRILIVEPDLKVARDLFLLFHFEYGRFVRECYEPEIAESVAEAIEQVQTISFHCIIIDVDLREMKGYEAIPLMKTINNTAPIIMTTGNNTLGLETKVREQDVYYYHIRSFGSDELKSAVNSVFENRQEVKKSRRPSIVVTKPVVLKQLRLCQRQEKRDLVITGETKAD